MSDGVWCKHIEWTKFYGIDAWALIGNPVVVVPNSWNICPVAGCNAPRPKEISLSEQFAEKLYAYYRINPKWAEQNNDIKKEYIDLANSMLEFLKGKI